MAAKKIKIDNTSSKFKKQSQRRETKTIRCSILIVCEGTKTEPNYFEAFAEKRQGVIVYDIEVKGLGRGTKDVVEKAIYLKGKNDYDRVWAVFDKDEFPAKDFNEAISLGQKNGIEVAWSDEAFELWYLYHLKAQKARSFCPGFCDWNCFTRLFPAQYQMSREKNCLPIAGGCCFLR